MGKRSKEAGERRTVVALETVPHQPGVALEPVLDQAGVALEPVPELPVEALETVPDQAGLADSGDLAAGSYRTPSGPARW